MFKTLDEVLAKRTQEDRAKIIADGDKLAAKRDLAVKAATGDTVLVEFADQYGVEKVIAPVPFAALREPCVPDSEGS